MARQTCRLPGCENPPDGRRFCSDRCEVFHDHLKADARDARLADAEAAREADVERGRY